jgi:hypothetical protein
MEVKLIGEGWWSVRDYYGNLLRGLSKVACGWCCG